MNEKCKFEGNAVLFKVHTARSYVEVVYLYLLLDIEIYFRSIVLP